MNKLKEKILIISIAIIIVVICFVIYFVNKNITTSNLYGKWVAGITEVYSNGKVTSANYSENPPYIEIKNNTISICYLLEDKYTCEEKAYTLQKEKLSVEENDTFLSGDFIIKIKKNKLELKKEHNNGELKIISHYKKES